MEETPVGMVTYINDQGPSMFQMWVDPSFRKQGIGEKLVLDLIQVVKKLGEDFLVCSVFKENKAALDLYLRLGFQQTHEDDEQFHLKWVF